jgi:hypothetical protein
MTYEEADELIRDHIDYGGSLDIHALAVAMVSAMASDDAARYRFLRNDDNWPQNDRYWEALSAGGEKLDKVIDDGIKSRAEDEESDDF